MTRPVRLHEVTRPQLSTLTSWFPDEAACRLWGGPWFRYPFAGNSFFEDLRWPELPAFVLVDDAGTMLAFGRFYDRLGRCHLGHLVVGPEHRGSGLGAELVTQLAQRGAETAGYTECSLFVLKDNTAAQALYRKLGFVDATYPEYEEWLDQCDYLVAPVRRLVEGQWRETGLAPQVELPR